MIILNKEASLIDFEAVKEVSFGSVLYYKSCVDNFTFHKVFVFLCGVECELYN